MNMREMAEKWAYENVPDSLWFQEFKSAYLAGFKAAIESAARVAEKWADNYPLEIFPAPHDGCTPDLYSARSARNSSRNIAENIRALTREDEE